MQHKLSFYKEAAELLKLAKIENKNVKSALYNERKYKFMNVKALYAIVSETLKHWEVLDALVEESLILSDHPEFNPWHVKVLITELMFGKKALNTDIENMFIQCVLGYEDKFKKIMKKEKIQNLLKAVHISNSKDLRVRYVKINTLKMDVDSVISHFINEGWKLLPKAENYEDYLNQLKALDSGGQEFLQDYHIATVLAFPPGTEFYKHELNKNSTIFLMDKSSCLAPFLLQPKPDSIVLDMCAAPGLKTVQLAEMAQTGKVYAVEKDHQRFKSLQEFVTKSGARHVETICSDVTKIDVKNYKDVEYILLDPSCSGSGIRDRQPNQYDGEDEKMRLKKLASFQLSLLRFALTRFPSAKRVVYSTCSLNVEENEEVVSDAIFSKYHNFKLAKVYKKLPGWFNFGTDELEVGSKCVYCRPESDLTTGFFIAVFKRKKIDEENLCREVTTASNFQTPAFLPKPSTSMLDKSQKISDNGKHTPPIKTTHSQNNQSSHVQNKRFKSTQSINTVKQDSKPIQYSSSTNSVIVNNHTMKSNTSLNSSVALKKLTQSQRKRNRRKKLKLNVGLSKADQKSLNSKRIGLKSGKETEKANFNKSKHIQIARKTKDVSKAKLRKERLKKLKQSKLSVIKQKILNDNPLTNLKKEKSKKKKTPSEDL